MKYISFIAVIGRLLGIGAGWVLVKLGGKLLEAGGLLLRFGHYCGILGLQTLHHFRDVSFRGDDQPRKAEALAEIVNGGEHQ